MHFPFPEAVEPVSHRKNEIIVFIIDTVDNRIGGIGYAQSDAGIQSKFKSFF
jgi:hypothetical protein